MAYVSLAVREKKHGFVPGAGFFTCGLLTAEQYHELKLNFTNGQYNDTIGIDCYRQNEILTLENETTNPEEIAVMIKTFGQLYILGTNLFDQVFDINGETENN
jgi:hypothetical protein